jgi:hypothetical protein
MPPANLRFLHEAKYDDTTKSMASCPVDSGEARKLLKSKIGSEAQKSGSSKKIQQFDVFISHFRISADSKFGNAAHRIHNSRKINRPLSGRLSNGTFRFLK